MVPRSPIQGCLTRSAVASDTVEISIVSPFKCEMKVVRGPTSFLVTRRLFARNRSENGIERNNWSVTKSCLARTVSNLCSIRFTSGATDRVWRGEGFAEKERGSGWITRPTVLLHRDVQYAAKVFVRRCLRILGGFSKRSKRMNFVRECL